jgi:hypothetical protein
VRHMREVAADLSAPAQDTAASAARTVARCLGLAKQAVEQTEVRTVRFQQLGCPGLFGHC